MKQIKFDARFKEAILKKQTVATIRNSKKVDVGEDFEIVVDDEVVGKAICIVSAMIPMESFEDSLTYFLVGMDILRDLINYHKTYLKNEHCYLHIFELIGE